MRIYLVRHAEAVAKAENLPDEEGALTDSGREQARALAAALSARGIELGAVISSPYPRAHQTAIELSEGLKPTLPDVIDTKLLAPDNFRPRKLSKLIAELGADSVAVVGHMPELGSYGEWLLGARDGSLPLAKAAAACIECDDGPRKSDGELHWLITPEWFQPPVKAATCATA